MLEGAGAAPVAGVLFDLDDTLVPLETLHGWQWAWRPQGPLLSERHVRAAVRRVARAWDRRRWEGLVGRAPPADVAAVHEHLTSALAAIAGHPLPPEEGAAVVRRLLHPAGEVEVFPEVALALRRLGDAGLKVGVVTELPAENARWLLKRSGLNESLLVVAGDPPGPVVPDPRAFLAGAKALDVPPERLAFVGDLLWSDVRAAERAGLRGTLLDRRGAWPTAEVGRRTTLEGFVEELRASGTKETASVAPPG